MIDPFFFVKKRRNFIELNVINFIRLESMSIKLTMIRVTSGVTIYEFQAGVGRDKDLFPVSFIVFLFHYAAPRVLINFPAPRFHGKRTGIINDV